MNILDVRANGIIMRMMEIVAFNVHVIQDSYKFLRTIVWMNEMKLQIRYGKINSHNWQYYAQKTLIVFVRTI